MQHRELSYSRPTEAVESLQFSLLSRRDVEEQSVCEVTSTSSFDGTTPVTGGLFDLRMGVTDNIHKCSTCHQGARFCPGHPGRLPLATPVFNAIFFDSVVIRVLKVVCWRCSRLLYDLTSPEMQAVMRLKGQRRFEAVLGLVRRPNNSRLRCGNASAHGCGARQPVRVAKHAEKFMRVMMEFGEVEGSVSEDGLEESAKSSERVVMGAREVLAIFSRIPDEDVEMMGFHPRLSRPENAIIETLLVPPPAVRPSFQTSMLHRSESDLTTSLISIFKANEQVKNRMQGGRILDVDDPFVAMLQYAVATMMDNDLTGVTPSTQRTGRAIVSISQRLKSKDGRVRGNMLGKRVEHSSRSVITPDPMISLAELGVPVRIAMTLTFPETVTHRNQQRLQALVDSGPDRYPGAKYVQLAGNHRTLKLEVSRAPPRVVFGDVVHRFMEDGDYVMFNRQPSLHKMSMMALRARVMEGLTFRLNPCATGPLNADFDGDESNGHVPLSVYTSTEIAALAAIPMNIMTPRMSKPIVSIVQDVPLGVWLISKPGEAVSRNVFCNLMSAMTRCPREAPAGTESGGRDALSLAIPREVNMVRKNARFDPDNPDAPGNADALVRIEHGRIRSGTLDKGIYQSSSGLVQHVYNEMGPVAAIALFDDTQRLVCDWFRHRGFSVGLSDMVMSAQARADVHDAIRATKQDVYSVIASIHDGTFSNPGLASRSEAFEVQVREKLDAARESAQKIGAAQISTSNRMMDMIRSGSKGKETNIVQMLATLGQQSVDGQRPLYGFDSRTLPHFYRYDDGPEARGFVESSFMMGLKPTEFFFHSMGGREGLMDTAVKTSESGYIQRKLIKAMEDCKVYHDGTVRNARGYVLQFLYGEDGMDAISIESQRAPHLAWDLEKLAEHQLLSPLDPLAVWMRPAELAAFMRAPGWAAFAEHFRAVCEEAQQAREAGLSPEVNYPVHVERILANALAEQSLVIPVGSPTDLDPRDALASCSALCADLRAFESPVALSLRVLLRSSMGPKEMLRRGVTAATHAEVVRKLRERFAESLVHGGEMVGIVAAQSIGEPTTQLTLNTFHQAGVASASRAVRGLPRIKELLSVSKNPKAVILSAALRPGFRETAEQALVVCNELETTTLGQLVHTSSVFLDPDHGSTSLREDDRLYEDYNAFLRATGGAPSPDATRRSPWLIRLVLAREELLRNNLTMYDVHVAISEYYRDTVCCMFADDNSEKLVFRLRLTEIVASGATLDTLSDVRAFELAMLDSVKIKGGFGVEHAIPRRSREVEDEWFLETDGRSLAAVLAHPMVDPVHTTTNDILEVLRVLGVEAAREAFMVEIGDVMKDAYVNPRHYLLLADTMCQRGMLQSIDRHGINKGDIGPLAKCGFEETVDVIRNAGVFAEKDNIRGVASSIMLGQIPKGGTGDSQLVLDPAGAAGLPAFVPDFEKPEKETRTADQICARAMAMSRSLRTVLDPAILRLQTPSITVPDA